MRHILVRADANGRIGLGHLLRTMSVADELARIGVCVTFLCRDITPWASQLLSERGHGLRRLDVLGDVEQNSDARATAALAKAENMDMILLDHYDLRGEWTDIIRSTTKCKIAAFDDLAAHRRDVDVLIDSSPGRQVSEYTQHIPQEAVCLTGPAYAPLRPEFVLERRTDKTGCKQHTKIVVSMGGSDPTGASIDCLDALDGLSDIELSVVLSSAAPMLKETQARISEMTSPTQLLLDRTDMAAILADADLVIGAGGTSALERCAMGLPSILAVLAPNQIHNATQLAAAGATIVLPDLSQTAIRGAVVRLLDSPSSLKKLGEAALQLCDGLGASRVAKALFAVSSDVVLRLATPDDMSLIYALQSEPDARRFARSPEIPTLDEHRAWYTARLERIDRDPFYVVVWKGMPCGFVRLDPFEKGDCSEVSILIGQNAQNQGVARQALGHLRLTHPQRSIVATIHPENAASQRLFETAGFERTEKDQLVSIGWADIAERQRHEN